MLHTRDLNQLPHPSADEQQHSQALLHSLRTLGAGQQQLISVEQFMQHVLYDPQHGYYTSQPAVIGAAGDFTTAPEIHAGFSRCLARQTAEALRQCKGTRVLECGGGNGTMAGDILLELEALDQLPAQYSILELSGQLRQRQQAHLKQTVPHLLPRIQWLHTLPASPFDGVILANEVVDAIPCRRFHYRQQQWYEACIRTDTETLSWDQRPLPTAEQPTLSLHGDHSSEWNPMAQAWLRSLGHCLNRGLILLIDYGFERDSYYHPQRASGTLRAHYRHHVHDDILRWPGLQDLSSLVEFTALAETAVASGLDVLGYAPQAMFLLNLGLLDQPPSQTVENIRWQKGIHTLTHPGAMGETFKVLALGRDLPGGLRGFAQGDQRHRL